MVTKGPLSLKGNATMSHGHYLKRYPTQGTRFLRCYLFLAIQLTEIEQCKGVKTHLFEGGKKSYHTTNLPSTE